MIELLDGVSEEKRTAKFYAAVACVFPDGRRIVTSGEMKGHISHEPVGENGFGYDPILYLPDLGLHSAELSLEEKNSISHRGKALREMAAKLAIMKSRKLIED